jgi:hypothetical protein
MPKIILSNQDIQDLINAGKSNNYIRTKHGVGVIRIKKLRNKGSNKSEKPKSLHNSLYKKGKTYTKKPKIIHKKQNTNNNNPIRKNKNNNKISRRMLIDEFQLIKKYFRKGERPSQVSAIAMFEKHLREILD